MNMRIQLPEVTRAIASTPSRPGAPSVAGGVRASAHRVTPHVAHGRAQ